VNQTTGYAKVAFYMIREMLKAGVEVFHYATEGFGDKVSLRKSEATSTHEVASFGFEELQAYCESQKIDVVLIYNDIGVVCSYLKHWSPPRLWVYLDTCALGIPSDLLRHVSCRAQKVFAMNEFWAEKYPFDSVHRILGHGVDTSVFKRLPASENASLRQKLGIPVEAKVFLNANRNSRRKRLDLTISSFVQYAKKHVDQKPYLLFITSTKNGFYDIQNILRYEIQKHSYDCSSQVLSINTDAILLDDIKMNQFFNIADVGLNTSTGEGFGLSVLELASLGIPQALTELPSYKTFLRLDEAEYASPLGDREYYEMTDYSGSFHDTFASADIVKAMEEASKLPRFESTKNSWSTALKLLRECCNESISLP